MKPFDRTETQPLVSIGLPVYNGGETLRIAIDSILKQDYDNFEVIISDNCSTDNTEEIAQAFCKEDSRFRYIKQHYNKGLIQNFNEVFFASSGEYFFWASHDDIRSSNYISTCVKALLLDQEAVLCSPFLECRVLPNYEVLWMGDLHTFELKKSLASRYYETLSSFPAAALYGVYRSSALRRTELLKNCIASDLILIQNLALYGTFIHTPQSQFTYIGREAWNNPDEDYKVFYGTAKKPRFFSPFLVVIEAQIQVIVNCELNLKSKLQIFSILARFQFSQFAKKFLVKLTKLLLPKKLAFHILMSLYWRLFHCPNVVVVNPDLYTRRVILPTLGWMHTG